MRMGLLSKQIENPQRNGPEHVCVQPEREGELFSIINEIQPLEKCMKKVKLHSILKKFIQDKKVSAREVSRSCGIPQSTITNFLSGRGPHRPEQVLKLANYFGCSMEFLLFGEDDRPPTLDEVFTEGLFDGWLRVKIERAVPSKRKIKVSDEN